MCLTSHLPDTTQIHQSLPEIRGKLALSIRHIIIWKTMEFKYIRKTSLPIVLPYQSFYFQEI